MVISYRLRIGGAFRHLKIEIVLLFLSSTKQHGSDVTSSHVVSLNLFSAARRLVGTELHVLIY